MDLRVLGPVELLGERGPVELRRGRPRRLLLALAVRAGEPVGADTLIDELWADDTPLNAGNALQVLVSYLRRMLASADDQPRIETATSGYRLLLERDELDANRFEDAVAAALRLSDPAAQVALLDEALTWWRGSPLMEATYDDFAGGMIAHLNEVRLGALERRVDARLAMGQHRELIGELRQLVTEHPLHERFHAQLMLALYRSDRQSDALRAYETARSTLVEELGLDPGPELQAMERAVLEQSSSLAAPSVVASVVDAPAVATEPAVAAQPASVGRTSRPRRTGRLLGRADAVYRLPLLVAEHRVLTLTGTGGAGKTRLAEAVADVLEEDVLADDGGQLWWADLSTAHDLDGVSSIIATAIGSSTKHDDVVAAIRDHLSSRHGVLVLDTCEHVIDELRPIVTDLATTAPGVMVLATSRQPLRVPGELAWPVPPLELPDPSRLDRSIGALPSVELFCERARSVRADFVLDDANAPAIGRICLLLDGIPLAIELAAAQVAVLRPDKLVRLLDDRLRVLVDDRGSGRQQTLRATIDWSYQLLDESEARFLDRLSVFAGSFDVEGAVVVAGQGLDREGYDLLVSLARQSLISPAGDERFRLLETIRAYAGERLRARDGDAETTRQRHAAWCTDVFVEVDRHLRGPDARGWLATARPEVPDLRLALDWAFAGGDPQLGARLATAASWFCGMEGLFADGKRWLDRAAAVEDVDSDVRAAVLMGRADHAASLGELDLAIETARDAAELYELIGEQRGLARSHLYLGVALWGSGRLDEAAEVQDRMAMLFRSQGDDWGFGLALLLRCRTAIDRDEDGIEEKLDTALAIARRGGDPHVIGLCLEQRSRLALRTGDLDLAVELGTQSLDHNRAVGYVEGVVASMHALGAALAATGRTDEARALHEDAMALAVDLDHPGAMAEGLENLALLLVATDPAQAVTLVVAADALRERRAVPRPRSFERVVEPARAAACAQLSPEEVERAAQAGRLLDVSAVARVGADRP